MRDDITGISRLERDYHRIAGELKARRAECQRLASAFSSLMRAVDENDENHLNLIRSLAECSSDLSR